MVWRLRIDKDGLPVETRLTYQFSAKHDIRVVMSLPRVTT
jgi:hypothetical protein